MTILDDARKLFTNDIAHLKHNICIQSKLPHTVRQLNLLNVKKFLSSDFLNLNFNGLFVCFVGQFVRVVLGRHVLVFVGAARKLQFR